MEGSSARKPRLRAAQVICTAHRFAPDPIPGCYSFRAAGSKGWSYTGRGELFLDTMGMFTVIYHFCISQPLHGGSSLPHSNLDVLLKPTAIVISYHWPSDFKHQFIFLEFWRSETESESYGAEIEASGISRTVLLLDTSGGDPLLALFRLQRPLTFLGSRPLPAIASFQPLCMSPYLFLYSSASLFHLFRTLVITLVTTRTIQPKLPAWRYLP